MNDVEMLRELKNCVDVAKKRADELRKKRDTLVEEQAVRKIAFWASVPPAELPAELHKWEQFERKLAKLTLEELYQLVEDSSWAIEKGLEGVNSHDRYSN